MLDSFPTVAAVLLIRRGAFFSAIRDNWLAALLGGALSLASYWIVIWAFTVAPIPIVAALRETSILFAPLIGMIWLGEHDAGARRLDPDGARRARADAPELNRESR